MRGRTECARCIMDTSDPDISFDENGNCNHCSQFFERAEREGLHAGDREVRLQQLVERIKRDSRGRRYDCVIGVSGGVDSTMVALKVKELGLRPLAVHFDNGWNSELAVHNIQRVLSQLQIDLHTHVVHWEEFRDLQMAFLKASLSNAEIPTDHGIFALLFAQAARVGVKYILTGSNLATEGIRMPLAWAYYPQDYRLLADVHKRHGQVPLRTMPRIALRRYAWNVICRGIRQIPFLNFFDYNRREAIEELGRTLGWRDYGGKHHESIYTRFYQGHILREKFGFDKRRVHLSTLICSGQVTREQAKEEIRKTDYPPDEVLRDRDFVCKKLQLSLREFDQVMAAPVRTYADYRSNAWLLVRMPALREAARGVAVGR